MPNCRRSDNYECYRTDTMGGYYNHFASGLIRLSDPHDFWGSATFGTFTTFARNLAKNLTTFTTFDGNLAKVTWGKEDHFSFKK